MRRDWLAGLMLLSSMVGVRASAGVFESEICGLKISLDDQTGGILKLEYPGPGVLLSASAERAGSIDLAYPMEKFEPLRLATRYSHHAKISRGADGAITVEWGHLGASRDFPLTGDVAATVTFRPAGDGRSVILSARVVNHSEKSVRQVVFPELSGMQAFAGKADTLFRTGGGATAPFLELAKTEERESLQYMIDDASYSKKYEAGGLFHSMVARWMDFGGLRGGVSLFPRRWGWEPQVVTWLQLSEVQDSLRLLCLHDVEIKAGATWESGEFWLTPHTGGWAKGIEPFRNWVKQNYKREWPVPQHVREGLGYRTVWMSQNQPNDPKDAVFKFSDLPKLAEESKAHGIDDMTIWAWQRGFTLPLPPPYPHLGSEKELIDAIAACKTIGVNVAPFISVLQANTATAPRYGLKVVDNNGWTYHTDMVPRWNPPYASGFACVPIPTDNALWQKDVLAGVSHLIDSGIGSLGWDQFWSTAPASPGQANVNTLCTAIRKLAKAADPESTFFGEELWNFDIDSAQLDYTWDWGSYRDVRPLTSVYPAPRVNCCISSSAMSVKKAFADNMYMNIFPRKAESVNGSDWIANHEELSAALKKCAALRKQFLGYFTDGTLIGDCVLAEPCAGAHVSAYVMGNRMLVIAINTGAAGKLKLNMNLESWIGAAADERFNASILGGDGKVISTSSVLSDWSVTTDSLESGGIVLFEVVGK